MKLAELAKIQKKALARKTFTEALAWIVDHYRTQRIDDTHLDADGDMLLFQWGTDDGKPYLDLTRQALPEDGGIEQLSCAFLFSGTMKGEDSNAWCQNPDELAAFVQDIRNNPWFQRFAAQKPTRRIIDHGGTGDGEPDPASPKNRKSTIARDRPLTAAERKQVDDAINAGRARLGVGPDWHVKKIQMAIDDAVTAGFAGLKIRKKEVAIAAGRARAGEGEDWRIKKIQLAIVDLMAAGFTGLKVRKKDRDQVTTELACLWGQTLCDEFAWEWRGIAVDAAADPDDDLLVIAPPDRSLMCPVITFISDRLRNPGGQGTILDVARGLRIKALPPSAPGDYMRIA